MIFMEPFKKIQNFWSFSLECEKVLTNATSGAGMILLTAWFAIETEIFIQF